MAKQKLVLAASPTFKAQVGIPVPGVKDTIPVEFTFRHRTRSDLKAWREGIDFDAITSSTILDAAVAWDLDDPFDDEHVNKMLEVFPGSGLAVLFRYLQEMQDARLGNSVR